MGIHVWRQTETQSTINNFYEEDMNILNPRKNDRGDGDGIFRMEFPLMQWLVACLYKVFGQHIILTRIFMFVVGIITVLGMYRLSNALFQNKLIALVAAWALNFSPSFYYYTINPLPDNFALCCSIWGIALFFDWLLTNRYVTFLVSGLLMSLGALCKLPFILYFIVPFTYFVIHQYKNGINRKLFLSTVGIMGFLALPFAWYLTVIPNWSTGIVYGMLDNQHNFRTILDYIVHNLISTLPELLLNYGSLVFFLLSFYFLYKNKSYHNPKFPLLVFWGIALLAYVIFEINMIAKIHDYYLFPLYPILFILVSYGAYNSLNLKNNLIRTLTILILIFLPVFAYLRMQDRWNPESPGFNRDLLVYKADLRNAIPRNSLVVAGNDESHFIFLYYIDKKGWTINMDKLTPEKLESLMEKGAEYLYSDGPNLKHHPEINQFLDGVVLERGSIKVYQLKP
jgi:4-amino-4-deoxy-L-arabinose transferase-like glycosyltransferase